jgi:hypothetical protein
MTMNRAESDQPSRPFDATEGASLRARLRTPRPTRPIPWGIMLLSALTGLLLGLGIKYPRVGRYQAELARTEDMLDVTRLKLRLASAAVDVQRGASDDAARQLRDFYAGAERAVAAEAAGARRVTGTSPTRAALGRALAQREATLARVGQRDPGAAAALLEQLADLRRAAPDGQPRP